MDTERIDALQKLPALKGAALSIVMAMLIAQRPLMAQELETYTGYSNPAVTKGLRTLAHFQAIVSLGKGRGYILTPAWRQLALPLSYPQDNQGFLDYPASIDDVDLILDSEREDHQTTKSGDNQTFLDFPPDHGPQGNAGSGQNATILRRIGIRGTAFRRYTTPPCPETAVILAWWFESLMQNLSNPPGWIICRLRDEDAPGDEHLELARFWLALDADTRADFTSFFDQPMLAAERTSYLAADFDLSQAAAALAVELWGLKAFEEQR